jgi:hypothetical protein
MSDWFLALATLAHILVFVYWLGGDLGAFYASTILTDDRQPTPARMAAARVLSAIDMAPRTALILAAPTGVLLGVVRGWLDWPWWSVALLIAASLAWLILAWIIHLRHAAAGGLLRRIDLGVRWAAVIAILALATNIVLVSHMFLQIKLACLAGAIVCGLLIRATLAPFSHAFSALARHGPSEDVNATIRTCLARARPFVLLIWALLTIAALTGIAKPY